MAGRGPGRVSSAVKDNMLRVFEDMGGVGYMTRWAKANPNDFLNAYMRLAPKEIIADVAGDLTINLVSQLGSESSEPDT